MSKKYKYVGKFYKTNNYGIIEILKYNHTDKYDKEIQGKYYQDSFEYYNKSFRKYALNLLEN